MASGLGGDGKGARNATGDSDINALELGHPLGWKRSADCQSLRRAISLDGVDEEVEVDRHEERTPPGMASFPRVGTRR